MPVDVAPEGSTANAADEPAGPSSTLNWAAVVRSGPAGQVADTRYWPGVTPSNVKRATRLPSVLGKGVYLGGWVEAGNAWIDSDDISFDSLR